MSLDTDAHSGISASSQSTLGSGTLSSNPLSSVSEFSERTLSSTKSTQDWTASQYASFTAATPSIRSRPHLPPPDPRDHTRLKACWEAMLAGRFLPQQLLAVLPFYLSSTFVNIQTLPSLQIVLPPNSISPTMDGAPHGANGKPKFRGSNQDIFVDTESSSGKSSLETNSDMKSCCSSTSPSSTASQGLSPPLSRMHLAKTFQTVSGCKEALWVEYEKIFTDSVSPVTRIPRPKEKPKDIDDLMSNAKRDEFEEVWSNWHRYACYYFIQPVP
jgi:hypothetical protein